MPSNKPQNPKGLTDAYCCQLLAWVHSYASAHKDKVLLTNNPEFIEDLTYAQKIVRLYNPTGPVKKLVFALSGYIAETKKEEIPDWAKDIFIRYGVEIPVKEPENVLKVKRTRQRTL